MKQKEKLPSSEKVKIILSLFLLLAIFSGSLLVVWQIKQKNQPTIQSQNSGELESQITELNKKIEDLSKAINDAKEQVKVESSLEVSTKTEKVAGASTSKDSQVSGLININSASASELDTLEGIGPAYAQRIIEYREGSGGFKSIEEIKNIKGIGDKTFEKIRSNITI